MCVTGPCLAMGLLWVMPPTGLAVQEPMGALQGGARRQPQDTAGSHLLPEVLPAPLLLEVLPVPPPPRSPHCAPSSELKVGEGDQWKLRLTDSVPREVTEMQKRDLKKDWGAQKNREGE